MKATKLMLAAIASFITTWSSISLIGYALSDMSLRECFINNGTIMFMLLFGWIPAFIITCDLDTKLKRY
jgi:hypothetical protein